MRRFVVLLALCMSAAAQQPYRENITVARILVDVRVTDIDGDPIRNLTPADFDVRLRGKRASVESVTWVDDVRAAAGVGTPSPSVDALKVAPPPGRLFLFFVQTDFARESFRISGQLDFLRYAEKMIDSYPAEDRFAVLQFDSHLKLRLDFTTDRDAVRAALRSSIYIDNPVASVAVAEPSLATLLDATAMRRAADSEHALLAIGNALRSVPGPKTLILIGWGLGRYSRGTVWMTSSWELARHALEASRTAIFALDVTKTSSHSLEVGLMDAAEQTGGFFAKTNEFPQQAIDRLQRTLAGHYEVELRRPNDLVAGTHDLRVRVKRRGATVLAPTSWMDRH